MGDPASSDGRPRSREDASVWMGELIGASVRITGGPGLAALPFEGVIVDETLEMFHVRPFRGVRVRKFPKAGLEGTILLGNRELPLKGDFLRVRPEDRTKRLSPRGHRRHS